MKFKKIPPPYIKILLDRLFRLKPAYERYERVFNDILHKFLIIENNEESENYRLNIQNKIKLATEIFNSSVGGLLKDNFLINYINNEEQRLFYKNELSEIYLNAKLNYEGALELIKNEKDLKINIKQMIQLSSTKENVVKLRKKYSLLYPVEKIVLCEGATEEILLEKLCEICGYNFKEEGVYVLAAGGKNQVARKYYNMIEEIKIPIFILLDNDAKSTKDLIVTKLRTKDKVYIINSGEFEDILPKKLIIKALNNRYANYLKCFEEDFRQNAKTVKELYDIFKQKGFGDFKKADFAKTIKEYICTHQLSIDNLSEEINSIRKEIRTL